MKHSPRRKEIHSLALVDFGYIFTRNYRGAGVNAPPNAAAEKTLREMVDIADDVDHVIICLDWPEYRRRQKYPEYKAQREERPPEELGQRRAILKELERRGFRLASAKGYEADDIIATLCEAHAGWCPDIRIVGPDKDMGQLIRTNVVQFVPAVRGREAEKRDRQRYFDKLGAWPEQMILWQALTGDSDDNVPGVKDIGPKKASVLCKQLLEANAPYTPEALRRYIEQQPIPNNIHGAVMLGYDDLVLSYDLVRLETDAPIDTEGLLEQRAPEAPTEVFMPTKQPPPDPEELSFPDAKEGEDPFRAVAEERNADRMAREQQEREREAERRAQEERMKIQQEARRKVTEEASPVGQEMADIAARGWKRAIEAQDAPAANETLPHPKAADGARAAAEAGATAPHTSTATAAASGAAGSSPAPKPKREPSAAIVTVGKGELVRSGWGLSTTALEPMDFDAAWNLARVVAGGSLYKFKTAEEVMTVIHRAKEMGLPVGMVLANVHMIEGKPSFSADLIRALAERDPNCVYFRLVSSDEEHATWETKHREHPTIDTRTYTIEQARKVKAYWKVDKWGNPGNWEARPEEMLIKTAGSKLARQVYPAATMGLYCPEEINGGYIDTVGEAA